MVEIQKSPEDDRIYKYIELANQMKVVLVSYPGAEKAAAALNVHVGHMNEPDDLPGLAHFCEHLLFMGTEKYPVENDYQKYISTHGGSSNAFTGTENTQYFFDVTAEFLEPALDRFAQFFLHPLFNEESKDKEIKAVHSEHEKNKQSDMWRLYQLEKTSSKPNHPFAKFGTGNMETLGTRPLAKGIDVRQELLKFHSQYYSANIMTLCVVSPAPIDELEAMAVEKFRRVANKNAPRPYFAEHPYGPEQLCEKLFAVPVKDMRSLELLFPLPDQHSQYRSHPSRYLSHLIGHEGQNSILSYLKSKDWANSLSAGLGNNSSGFSMFRIHMELTKEGLEVTDDIVHAIFEYIAMLQHVGIQERVFKECQALGEMQFRFKDKERPISIASSIVSSLQLLPPENVLNGDYRFEVFDPEGIQKLLDLLHPRNCRIVVVSKSFEPIVDREVEFYGTRYKNERIPEELLARWASATVNPALQLPPRNEFIPTDFSIVPRAAEVPPSPTIVRETPLSRIWFKQDNDFLLPKATAVIQLTSPLAYVDPAHSALTRLFSELLRDSLNEFAYDAEIAGLDYSISADFCGLIVRVDGYSHKLGLLVEKIFEKMSSFKLDPSRFAQVKEAYSRELDNFEADQPSSQAIYFTNFLLSEKIWSHEEKKASLPTIGLETLQSFVPRFLSRLFLECLVHGNATAQDGIQLIERVETALTAHNTIAPLLSFEKLKYRCFEIPAGKSFFYARNNSVRDISAVENFYQIGIEEMELLAFLQLLSQILSEPCFNQLRTKEQLGYIVHSRIKQQNGVYGISIIVQSERHPSYVDERIEVFLQQFQLLLALITPEEFQSHIGAVITKITEKDKTIRQRSSRYWSEIYAQQYNFNRAEQQVELIRGITPKSLLEFFQKHLAPTSTLRRKISIHVLGTLAQDGAANTAPAGSAGSADHSTSTASAHTSPLLSVVRSHPMVQICDVTAFKRSLPLYPLKLGDVPSSKL